MLNNNICLQCDLSGFISVDPETGEGRGRMCTLAMKHKEVWMTNDIDKIVEITLQECPYRLEHLVTTQDEKEL